MSSTKEKYLVELLNIIKAPEAMKYRVIPVHSNERMALLGAVALYEHPTHLVQDLTPRQQQLNRLARPLHAPHVQYYPFATTTLGITKEMAMYTMRQQILTLTAEREVGAVQGSIKGTNNQSPYIPRAVMAFFAYPYDPRTDPHERMHFYVPAETSHHTALLAMQRRILEQNQN